MEPSSERELFEPAEPERGEAEGFAFRPARSPAEVSHGAWVIVRMSLVVAILAAVVAAALLGLGLLVKLQLDRFLGD